jgi:hypothetical protein
VLLHGGEAFDGKYVIALVALNRSPLNASEIPKLAELGLSGLGNSFKTQKPIYYSQAHMQAAIQKIKQFLTQAALQMAE